MATELSHDLSLAFDTYSKVSQAERKYLKLSVEKSVFFSGGNRGGIRKLSCIFFLMIWCWKKGKRASRFSQSLEKLSSFSLLYSTGKQCRCAWRKNFHVRLASSTYVFSFLDLGSWYEHLTWDWRENISRKKSPQKTLSDAPHFFWCPHIWTSHILREIFRSMFFYLPAGRAG